MSDVFESCAPPAEQERRKSKRGRVMLSGRIAGIASSPVLGCAIRDIGASGAQIWLPDAQPIPDEVYLIDAKNHVAYNAHVVRKTPLPETNGCARQCLESLLGLLDEAAPGSRASP